MRETTRFVPEEQSAVIRWAKAACPEEVASQLSVPPDSEVFLLKRIRYVDDDAVSIEESWVPVELIHDPDAIGISLYDYFRSQNIFPQRTRSRSLKSPRRLIRGTVNNDDVGVRQVKRPLNGHIASNL